MVPPAHEIHLHNGKILTEESKFNSDGGKSFHLLEKLEQSYTFLSLTCSQCFEASFTHIAASKYRLSR
ncbi:unnamed protein product [Acanthoscelides obtectus]|uniref:Uncharacterized protein n=1 Tax=Acanthoscelides obtectus TaxID=200917 RepID=A0A9P0P746_ACAOB|nr:unnamed protein product [Acanthoscelides obtectus]CAK1667533.1 hypothetical protein AOBTE_LOCUS25896 [Acanthoscelides obtectus]